MSLLQKAVRTYDALQDIAGIIQEGKEPLAPVGHIISTARILITISKDGDFIDAKNIELKVPAPCSEDASSRTSGIAPFVLTEQMGYVAEDLDPPKHEAYVKELESWATSKYTTPKLQAVYQYMQKGTVLKDLEQTQMIRLSADGDVKNIKDIITWNVDGLGTVYDDKELHDSFVKYYLDHANMKTGVCMVTGKIGPLAEKHLKGIVSFYGNAKLVSAADKQNFTYRGIFRTPEEALTIGYEASQKAHNALKYLLSNEGISIGKKRMICWNPDGSSIPEITAPLVKNDDSELSGSYQERIKDVLFGFRQQSSSEISQIVIAVFDAVTAGRLSLTYYSELPQDDFLERLGNWDEQFCYQSNRYGVQSPSLPRIVNCAFGTYRASGTQERFETDPAIYGKQLERILACRLGQSLFPRDIITRLRNNASTLYRYSNYNREMIVATTCAAVRKFRKDHYQEEWDMVLDKDKKDRSYQYGRLLATLEKAELDTMREGESRETNAIRMQTQFVQRPYRTAATLITKLKTAYLWKLQPGRRKYFDRMISEILAVIEECGGLEPDKALTETYLMGYYHQKNDFYTKHDHAESEQEER